MAKVEDFFSTINSVSDIQDEWYAHPKLLHQYTEPDAVGLEKLRDVIERLNMSARAYDRILKVARTIADPEATSTVQHHHIN